MKWEQVKSLNQIDEGCILMLKIRDITKDYYKFYDINTISNKCKVAHLNEDLEVVELCCNSNYNYKFTINTGEWYKLRKALKVVEINGEKYV